MKKLINILPVALILGLVGCATTNQDQQAAWLRRASSAAYLGSTIYLVKNPQAQPAFEQVYTELQALEQLEKIDPPALAALLQKLPIKELKGGDSAIYVALFVVVWDEVTSSGVTVDNPLFVRQYAAAIRQGIGRSLGK